MHLLYRVCRLTYRLFCASLQAYNLAGIAYSYAPQQVQPTLLQLGTDIQDLLTQQPTAPGLVRLGVSL